MVLRVMVVVVVLLLRVTVVVVVVMTVVMTALVVVLLLLSPTLCALISPPVLLLMLLHPWRCLRNIHRPNSPRTSVPFSEHGRRVVPGVTGSFIHDESNSDDHMLFNQPNARLRCTLQFL